MKKLDATESRKFATFASYFEAGGSPEWPPVVKFCQRNEIDPIKWSEEIREHGKDYWMYKLKNVGLVE